MENAVEICLWLSAIAGLGSLFFIAFLPALLLNISWHDWIEDLSLKLVRTVLGLFGVSVLINAAVLCLLNIRYWVAKDPFGWHDLPAMNVIAHDQFGALLGLSSLGGTLLAFTLLAWIFKREYVW